MSIESRLSPDNINITNLSIEDPDLSGEVYFEEDKILPDSVWQKVKESYGEDLRQRLAEPNPQRRLEKLASYYDTITRVQIFSPERAREVPMDPAVFDAMDAVIQKSMEDGDWDQFQDDAFDYLIINPQRLQKIHLTDEQYNQFRASLSEKENKGLTENLWERYWPGCLLLKHLYPNEPEKWEQVKETTLRKFKEHIRGKDVEEKLVSKLFLPEFANEFNIPDQNISEIYKNMRVAQKNGEWKEFLQFALAIRLANAEEADYTPNGLELKIRTPNLGKPLPSMPETKKF